MIPFLLLLFFGADTDCPGDGTLEDLRKSTSEITSDDDVALRAQIENLLARVDCLEEVVTFSDAMAVHSATAVKLQLDGDKDGATRALLAARALAGPTELPTWSNQDLLLDVQEPIWVDVVPPEQTTLFIDGVPMVKRPINRPGLYQAMGQGGKILWSAYIPGPEALPEGYQQAEGPKESDEKKAIALLSMATQLLAQRAYEQVLQIALPAISQYPDYSASFRALADIAIEQMGRNANVVERRDVTEMADVPLDRGDNLPTEDVDDRPRYRHRKYRHRDKRKGILVGFDIGLPTGARLEWKARGGAVDGVGIRVGGNLLAYASGGLTVLPVAESLVYVDFNLSPTWQLETGMGGFLYYGTVYFQTGVAIQWDPPSPIQVNAGVRIGVYGPLPDVSVGFLW